MTAHILSMRHRATLEAFAASNVLIAFDFDGTLAPICEEPAQARMRASTRRLMAAVAERYPCAVVSGRSWRDVRSKVDGLPIWHLAGNHGLEPWGENPTYVTRVNRWVDLLQRRLAGVRGVVIEDKRFSVTVHYRHARNKRQAIAALDRVLPRLRGARAISGIQAVNIVPTNGPNKGVAVERARRLLLCDAVIFAGDDETDEDVFRSADRQKLLGIRIGRTPRTAAAYGLRNQREIDTLLRVLVLLRPPCRETPIQRHRFVSVHR
jgi:trehalose 6-phosphate phosphatase